MFRVRKQYTCAVCGNVSWEQEICHDHLMEEVCFCGSGKLLRECHKEQLPPSTLS